jgi:hypothetical protein
MDDRKQWPPSLKRLHTSIGISSKDVKTFNHHSMRIDVAIHGSLEKCMKLSLTVTSQASGSPGPPGTQSKAADGGQSSRNVQQETIKSVGGVGGGPPPKKSVKATNITAGLRIPKKSKATHLEGWQLKRLSALGASASGELPSSAAPPQSQPSDVTSEAKKMSSLEEQPSKTTAAQSQPSDRNSNSDNAEEQSSSATAAQPQPSDTSEKDERKEKSSERNLKKKSKEVGQTETKLTSAIERILNGVFKQHPSATLLQLRHHIEKKYRGTLPESQ